MTLASPSPWFTALLSCALPAFALAADYPGRDWDPARLRSPEELRTAQCRAFVEYGFYQKKPDVIRTDAVIVIKDGAMVYEQYAPDPRRDGFADAELYYGPYTKDRPHILWSASKSVTATLVGAAMREAEVAKQAGTADDFTLDTKLADERFYPVSLRSSVAEPKPSDTDNAAYGQITVRHLLEMGAGIAWSESYESDPISSSVIAMLYLQGAHDMVRFTLSQPMSEHAPGTFWNYSSGNSSLLMGMLSKRYAARGLSERFPWTLLFDKLSFAGSVVEPDGSGVFVGSSYVHLRPQDMAKIGYLYLRDGFWTNGERLLPSYWVKESTKIAGAYRSEQTVIEDSTREGVFGLTWWLNRELVDDEGKPLPGKPATEVDQFKTAANGGKSVMKPRVMPYPDLEPTFFGAFGHYGQYIFVLPQSDMVIVRTADDRDPQQFDVNHWVKAAVDCFNRETAR